MVGACACALVEVLLLEDMFIMPSSFYVWCEDGIGVGGDTFGCLGGSDFGVEVWGSVFFVFDVEEYGFGGL